MFPSVTLSQEIKNDMGKFKNLSRKKKLVSIVFIVAIAMLSASVVADVFSTYVTYENEFTVDLPVFSISETGAAGTFVAAEDYLYTGTPVSGGSWADMTSSDSLFVASVDAMTIYFIDTSDDGMNCKVSTVGNPGVHIDSFTMSASETYEFIIDCWADPKIKQGTWTASMIIDDSPAP